MQGGQSRGERTGAGKDRFFVSLLLLDLFCLWSVKSCSDGCPPRLGCTQEVLVARAAAALFRREKVRAGLGCRCPVASSDEIFLLFFCLFFFLFHFVEIFTAIGEEERSKRTP